MSSPRVLTLLSLPLLAIPAVASAQEAIPPAPPEVEVGRTVFPTMGADGSASELGAQLTLMSGDGDTVKRLDVNGQYMTPGGLGAYLTLGASAGNDEFALGSLEVGGLFRKTNGRSDFGVRGGIVLPTGSNDENAFFLNLLSTAYSRPADYLTGVPETTSLRLAATTSMHSGNFVGRADVGVDMPVAGEFADEFDSPFLHINLGAGYANAKGAALVELSNMIYLEETDEMLHLLAVTAELHAGKTTPYLTISRPFGSGGGEDLDITNIGLGVRGRI